MNSHLYFWPNSPILSEQTPIVVRGTVKGTNEAFLESDNGGHLITLTILDA